MSLLDKVVTRRAAGWRAFARLRVRQGGLVTRLNCLRWCQSAVQALAKGRGEVAGVTERAVQRVMGRVG